MLLRRSLAYYRLENLAVMLGVAVGATVLTGSIIVGDSVRGSLRAEALSRLGTVEFAATSAHFFREELGDSPWPAFPSARTVSVIVVRGSAVHSDSGARANRTSIFGIDDGFWALDSDGDEVERLTPVGREVVLNEALADELGASVGDSVLLRLGKASPIATDTLLGRRDDVTTRLRLTVRAIVPNKGVATFSLRPQQQTAQNAFVSRELLQRQLNQPNRANVVLLGEQAHGSNPIERTRQHSFFIDALQQRVTLEDVGLSLRTDFELGYVALESDRLLINPAFAALADSTAKQLNVTIEPVTANLANSIRIKRGGQEISIPYSTVVSLPKTSPTIASMVFSNGSADAFGQGKILLNDWAAKALGATVGERVELAYFVLADDGELVERIATFELAATVAMAGAAIDRSLTPEYPGITDAARVSDWDPPFPVDLSRIGPRDEDYWDKYRATPKAFVELTDGLRLWHDPSSQHGRYTSIRFRPKAGEGISSFADGLRESLTHGLDLNAAGIRTLAMRSDALAAGKGSTDFGVLFVSFGFFLLASSAMLVMLLFRLNIERRGREIGLLVAVGFSARQVRRIFLSEGVVIATVGSLVGLVGAFAYSWLMLAGLKTWWSDAVSAPFLQVHCAWYSPIVGIGVSIAVSLASIAWSQRGSLTLSPAALLQGAGHERVRTRNSASRNRWMITSVVSLVVAAGIAIWGMRLDGIPKAGAFFGSGSAMLVAVLAMFGVLMLSPKPAPIGSGGTWVRLGLRNAARHPGRSLLTSALIGSGAFLVISLQAFRLNATDEGSGIKTASGGFELIAESDVPLPYSLASTSGRSSLGMGETENNRLAGSEIIACSLRPGDETSCRNLYVPGQPRILGAPDALIDRSGFRFNATTDAVIVDRENPWTALRLEFDDGAIPVIADEAVVKWQLHSGLNRDLVITDENGRDVTLRFVALLAGSTLQSELIVSADNFSRLFPRQSGGRFFLIDTPPDDVAQVESLLETQLADFGLDAEESIVRLQGYFAVQNTYLSTFQTLGGMGLVLGSFGLTAVLLRNVWERRREFALMRALGFSQLKIGMGVLVENVLLVAIGFTSAVMAAAMAVLPQLLDRTDTIPWMSLVWIVTGVIVAGIIAGFVALVPTLRSPMLDSLRSE